MTPDIKLSSIPLNSLRTGPSSAPATAAAVPLELLRPIAAATLAPGESASAEVLQNRPRDGQFELLLRLARANAAPVEVSVRSPQPLPAGTELRVQALSPVRLLAVLAPPAESGTVPPTLTRLDPQLFPNGTLLQARVMDSQPVAGEQNRFALLARLLQGPAAGALLSLDSSRPQPPGTLLTAAVENGALRLSSASEQVRQLDLLQGMRLTLPDQAPATPMLRTLERLASLPDLPPLLQASMQQVLKHVATPEHLATPAGVAQAIRQSGIFLEASLQQLQQALSTGNAAPSQGTAENTPAAVNLPPLTRLLPLLASLATPPGTEPLPGADFKASVLNLLVTLQQHLPADPSRSLAIPPGPWQPSLQVRPGLFPLPTRAVQALTENADLGGLLRLTAALLSRIQHHQFQSLGQTQTFADGSTQTVWQLDLPLRDGQQFTQVQLRIQREQQAPDRRQSEQTPQWEIRLAFNLDHLGPLQVVARLYKGRVSSEFWAEQASTLRLVNSQLEQLRDRLLTRGLEVGELSCHRGSPPQPQQAVQQRWIDEVT